MINSLQENLNLSRRKAVQKAGCVFACLCGGHKMIS